ncbi:hypothetical protein [Rubinisphaera sp.]|uniref:hypothetical protein n=1 Tax=Rubinisphaera sp. TaxID=2024857 RepID=UPI000C0FC5CC|nr:hypothetical protein [Rubinisphaera sp.]MBV08092.1 hypothetical protein [Rubinisphaera sp.]HCS55359.1 hypothetical protein [Planctomycetaceae bacterium]|tara:strand:+ start:992 stop:2647 length:1656 start_codon:yes stop_codon:yes gene_type:complete
MTKFSQHFIFSALMFVVQTTYASEIAKDKNKSGKKPDTKESVDSPFRISKETTRILEPVHPDAYMDYVAALNESANQGVKPEDNAAVALNLLACWSKKESDEPMEEIWFNIFDRLNALDLMKSADSPIFVSYYNFNNHEDLELTARVISENKYKNALRIDQDLTHSTEVEQYLIKNKHVVEYLINEVSKPQFFDPIIMPVIPFGSYNVTKYKQFAELLLLQTRYSNSAGNQQDAIKSLKALFQITRHLKCSKVFLDRHTGFYFNVKASQLAATMIQSQNISPETLKQISILLNSEERVPETWQFVDETHRFELLQIIQLYYLGLHKSDQAEFMEMPNTDRLDSLLASQKVDWDSSLIIANSMIDELVKLAITKSGMEYREAKRNFKNTYFSDPMADKMIKDAALITASRLLRFKDSEKRNGKFVGTFFALWMMTETYESREPFLENEEWIELTKVALDIKTYQLKHSKLPKSLNELYKDLDRESPQSIFGEPFVYLVEGENYHLYSKGIDGIAQDGIWHDKIKNGKGISDDIGIYTKQLVNIEAELDTDGM